MLKSASRDAAQSPEPWEVVLASCPHTGGPDPSTRSYRELHLAFDATESVGGSCWRGLPVGTVGIMLGTQWCTTEQNGTQFGM